MAAIFLNTVVGRAIIS